MVLTQTGKDLLRDILLKGAEDVAQGMWCRGAQFAAEVDEESRYVGYGTAGYDQARYVLVWPLLYTELVGSPADSEMRSELMGVALGAYRCAEGSLQVATAMLGGDPVAWEEAVSWAEREIAGRPELTDGSCESLDEGCGRRMMPLAHFNDAHLTGMTPFEAGQVLAEIFRSAAERL